MDPISTSTQVVPLIERTGVIGTVVVCCALMVAGMLAALAVLWRAREAERVAREKSEQAHYQWAMGVVERFAADEQRLTAVIQELVATLTQRGQRGARQ